MVFWEFIETDREDRHADRLYRRSYGVQASSHAQDNGKDRAEETAGAASAEICKVFYDIY